MIEYHHISLDDKEFITSCISGRTEKNCEYSFGNILCYGEILKLEVANYAGSFISRSNEGGTVFYCFPAGGNVEEALRAIVKEARETDLPAVMFGIGENEAKLYNSLFPDMPPAKEDRDFFDYCYNSRDLITLSGKKYQSKRNHISFFERNNNFSYEPMTKAHAEECLRMNREWLSSHIGDPDGLDEENEVIERAFRYFDDVPFKGGVLRADGRVIAFTIGEELDSEHFCVHFEKAFASVRGAYPAINRYFAENALSGYKYINREDDAGIENLRKAKLSYHPAYLLKKFRAVLNDAT